MSVELMAHRRSFRQVELLRTELMMAMALTGRTRIAEMDSVSPARAPD